MTTSRRVGTNENVSTYGNGTRDYTVLSTWETATDNDLVTAQLSEILECYDDAVFDDTVILGGATTDASYFRVVRPASGQGHIGTPTAGVRFAATTGTVFTINEAFTSLQDLVVSLSANSAGNLAGILIGVNANDAPVVGCITHQCVNAGAGAARGITVSGTTADAYVVNSLAFGNDDEGFFVNTAGTTYFYNCTAVGNNEGFQVVAGAVILKNCLGDSNTTADFVGSFDASSVTNASSDLTAPGTSPVTEAEVTYVNAEILDYHLSKTDTGVKNLGTDLSADAVFPFNDDIDGDTITTWNIGFDEEGGNGMASLTKTQDITVLTHQAVTHPATVKGAAQDVSTHFGATIVMFHALVEAAANTNPGSFFVQVSTSATGNEDWATVAQFTANNTTPDTEALTATEPLGETVLAVLSTTGFAAGDLLYIQDSGALTDSEWALCQEIATDVSITLVDGLSLGKDSADVIWNDANIFVAQLDLTAVARLRVIFLHEGAIGANVHVKAKMVTGDSIA